MRWLNHELGERVTDLVVLPTGPMPPAGPTALRWFRWGSWLPDETASVPSGGVGSAGAVIG